MPRHTLRARPAGVAPASSCPSSPPLPSPSRSAQSSATRSTLFSSAVSSCGSPAGAQFGDGGRTLTLRTRGAERHSSGMSVQDLRCILAKLGASDAVISRMSATRALDGMQDGQWEGIRASWTYHPDDGLNITLTMN